MELQCGDDDRHYTNMKFASHLEAQYIIAEADGGTASTLNFVNARRAVGIRHQ